MSLVPVRSCWRGRLHDRSPRRDAPFIPVSCPAISETLFESQFYGHVKGSFTGAASDTLGVVRAADDGTLLLDEVGELALNLQPKLLRLLQEREVIPVGASKPVTVNARFIGATNRSLLKRVLEGTFRRDLYHRLNIVCIEIPPLRSRPEDIPVLLDYYVEFFAGRYEMPRRRFSPYLLKQLAEYPWPGNVRELCGYVERLYATNLPATLPEPEGWDDGYAGQSAAPGGAIPPAPGRMGGTHSGTIIDKDYTCTMAEWECHAIRKALERTNHNRSAAAKLLDIHRSTLLRKIRLLGLDDSAPGSL